MDPFLGRPGRGEGVGAGMSIRAGVGGNRSGGIIGPNGVILTGRELRDYCDRKGLCVGCGTKTHKIRALGKKPITNAQVMNGVCLRCNPSARERMTADVTVAPPPQRTDSLDATTGVVGGPTSSLSLGTASSRGGSTSFGSAPSHHRQASEDSSGRVGVMFRKKWGKVKAAATATAAARTFSAWQEPSVQEEQGEEEDHSNQSEAEDAEDAGVNDTDRALSADQASFSSSEPSGDPPLSDQVASTSEGNTRSNIAHNNSDRSMRSGSTHSDVQDESSSSFAYPDIVINDEADAFRVMKSNEMDRAVLTHALQRLRIVGPVNSSSGDGDGDDGAGRGLREIAEIMRRHPRDAPLQAAACGAVWRLTSSTKCDDADDSDESDGRKADAIGTGCLDCIVSAVTTIPGDSELACWAIGAMACILGDRQMANVVAMFEAGGVSVVASALRKHAGSAEVFEWSARALHGFMRCRTRLDSAKTAILQSTTAESVLEALLKSMQQNQNSIVAQTWAFSFLWLLINHSGEGTREWDSGESAQDLLEKILEEGGMTLCEQILKSRLSSDRLKQMALALLHALMRQRHGGQDVGEVISVTKALIKEYPVNTSIQGVAMSILADFIPDHETIVVVGDSIRSIINAMEIHSRIKPVQESACWLLWGLSTDRSYWTNPSLLASATQAVSLTNVFSGTACNILANFALVPNMHANEIPINAIVGKIASATSCEHEDIESDCAYAGCRAVSNICMLDVSKVSDVVNAGGVDALVKVMSALKSDENVQDEAIGALCQVLSSSNDSHRKAVITAGGIDLIADAMRDFHSTESIQIKGLYALCMLAMCHDCSAPSVHKGVIDAVLNAMRRFPDHTDIQTRSCLALRNLSLAANASSTCSAVDSVNSLVELIQRSNSSILQKEACGAIYALIANCTESDSIPLYAAFNAMIKILDDNRGDQYDRPFNPVILSEALGGLEILTDVAIEQHCSLHATTEMIDIIISIVYASLDAEVPSAEVIEGVLAVVLNLSQDKEYERDLIQCGCIVAVIDSIAEMVGASGIEEIGCGIFSRLCVDNLDVKYGIVESDGIEAIVNAMMNNPDNVILQTSACEVLAQLTIDEESKYLITQSGGVMLIVSAMQNLPDKAALQEKACSALCNLVCDNMGEDVLLSSGIIGTVLDVMRCHAKVPAVQAQALGILQNVSMKSTNTKEVIASSGGVEVTLSSMKENSAFPDVLERAFTTLWSLAVLDSNQDRIADADGTKVIIIAMMACVDLAKVQKQACGCLCTLSANPRCKESIKRHGGLDAILFSMWYHYKSESLLTEACRALSSLAVNSSNEEEIVVKETIIDAIVRAMVQFPDSGKLLELTCLALRNFSLSATNVRVMRERVQKLEPLLHKASAKFPGECSQRANQVLTRLVG